MPKNRCSAGTTIPHNRQSLPADGCPPAGIAGRPLHAFILMSAPYNRTCTDGFPVPFAGLPMTTSKRPKRKRISVPEFVELKSRGQKICVLTAYDYPAARLVDAAGVDAILVGDSMAMVVQGHDTTLPVTLDEMIYHGEMVVRAARHALVIVDLPFPTFHLGVHKAIELAGRVLKETGCQAVKLEGGQEQREVIAGLVSAGIPVMAHVGLRPQSVHTMGGYKVQRDNERLLADALAAEEAGAFGIVLECIPGSMAAGITARLTIPTIGIGAGPDCDGQVLVLHDLLGLTSGRVPTFVKQYANLSEIIESAVGQWCQEVRDGGFPDEARSFE
jgi:3-methyl-2-oxobutanoate hydroxymethyltransferase